MGSMNSHNDLRTDFMGFDVINVRLVLKLVDVSCIDERKLKECVMDKSDSFTLAMSVHFSENF